MNIVWINGHKVDWQRGEVIVAQQTRSIEPRALQVLKVLVASQAQVVAQQEIISQVWGDVIVAPNALQRCIAQLRKSLDDDARRQQVIKTYPKLGYSLVANVSESSPERLNERSSDKQHKGSLGAKVVLGLIFFSIMAGLYYYFQPTTAHQYTQVTPLTSSDTQELATVLSPDQKTLAFVRVIAPGNHQLIVRDMQSGAESLLLSQTNIMGKLAFSNDGAVITFGHLQLIDNKKCARLIQVEVTSKQVSLVKDCHNAFWHSPHWIDNANLLAFHQAKNADAKLIRVDLTQQTVHAINGVPHAMHRYAYNEVANKLAYIALIEGQWFLSVGKLLNDEFSPERQWPLPFMENLELASDAFYPHWRDASQVMLAANNKIYQFNLDGEVTYSTILSNDKLYNILPYQQAQLIVEIGHADWDIGLFNWRAQESQYQTIGRSTAQETQAQFRPEHQGIATLSSRTGKGQVWLVSQGQSTQLTQASSSISHYLWSPDGLKLIYLSDSKLFLLDLSKQSETQLKVQGPVTNLFQWIVDEKGHPQLLIELNHNGKLNIVSLDLTSLSQAVEIEGSQSWVQKVGPHQFIVSSQHGQLQLLDNGQRLAIAELGDVVLHWRFYLRDDAIYLQDKRFNIWQFNLRNRQAKIVGQFDQKALLMTDIQPAQQHMLSERLVGENKEIMLLK